MKQLEPQVCARKDRMRVLYSGNTLIVLWGSKTSPIKLLRILPVQSREGLRRIWFSVYLVCRFRRWNFDNCFYIALFEPHICDCFNFNSCS